MAMTMALAGGVLIGLAAVMLYGGLGRIAGISGITYTAFERGQRHWRLAFLVGLMVAPWIAAASGLRLAEGPLPVSTGGGVLLAVAGLLVGIGTRLGNGCTSGHGICGLSRFSPRSFAAVAVFMAVGMAVATLLRPLLVGDLS